MIDQEMESLAVTRLGTQFIIVPNLVQASSVSVVDSIFNRNSTLDCPPFH